MKGIKTELHPEQFFINLDKEEFLIIKQGLGHLQLNYLSLLEEKKDCKEWNNTRDQLDKVNRCLQTIKYIEEDETEN